MNLLKNIKKKLLSPEVFAGVDLILHSDQQHFNVIVLKRKKGEIQIAKKVIGLTDTNELFEALGSDIPIYLSLNGKSILHRQVESNEDLNNVQLLNSVLPNSDPSDFYIESVISSQATFVSIIRKNILDHIIEQLTTAQLCILQVGIGSFDVRFLSSYIPDVLSIQTEKQIINLSEAGEIHSFSANNKEDWSEVKIGDDYIDSRLAQCYAGAFKGLIGIPSNSDIANLNIAREEFSHKTIYKKGSIALLGGLLFVLIINTGLYYNYKSSNAKLSTQLLYKNGQLQELDILKSKLDRQEKLLKTTSINQSTRTSFYADQIGKSVPDGISLTKLSIFPIEGKKDDYTKSDLVKFKKNEILIAGSCKSSKIYNQWIKDLQGQEWIKTVRHLNYKDISNSLGEFELNVLIAASK